MASPVSNAAPAPTRTAPTGSLADHIRAATASDRARCVDHPLFARIQTVAAVRVFMAHHVYAVLDFMSLAYCLRVALMNRHDAIAWTPWATPAVRRFVNEVILDECSDELPDGRVFSHYELYLEAMKQAGAPIDKANRAVEIAQQGRPLPDAVRAAGAPAAAVAFVSHTMTLCETALANRQPHLLAAVFAFTREQVIPDMFTRLVSSLAAQGRRELQTFDLYLRRHIEMDGDKHGALAEQMVDHVATPANVDECVEATRSALHARADLWSAIESAL
jgi:hypothetical protein